MPDTHQPGWGTFTLVVHGESGVGKSWLGDTAPAPRLLLDAEGGTRFTPSNKVVWDPMREAPPDGAESVVATVRDFGVMQRIFQWLNSGQHPFASVVHDSLTEIQKRCKDSISGTDQLRQQDWGELLRQMEFLVRQYRDLTMHPLKPLKSVTFIATTMMDERKTLRPNVQGQLRLTMPQFVDVVGYLYVAPDAEGNLRRVLMTAPYPGYIAKDRTNKLGTGVFDPNIEKMMEVIYANS